MLMSQREKLYMTTNETAKPCPSSEQKKSNFLIRKKVVILKKVLDCAATLYRIFNLVDCCWNSIKDHCSVILEWFESFL